MKLLPTACIMLVLLAGVSTLSAQQRVTIAYSAVSPIIDNLYKGAR